MSFRSNNVNKTGAGTKHSIFWRYFAMMGSFIVLMLAALLISNRITRRTQMQELLTETTTNLQSRSSAFAQKLYSITAVPGIVEDSQPYHYVENLSGELPDKYVPIIAELRTSLLKQALLLGDTADCMIAFPQFGIATSRRVAYGTVEAYFSEAVQLEKLSAKEGVRLISTRGIFSVQPMQYLRSETGASLLSDSRRYLPVIVHPSMTKTGVLVLYSEETVMDELGFRSLPEGSRIVITDEDGTVIAAYPEDAGDEAMENAYSVTARTGAPSLEFTVWIPKSYYDSLLASYMRMSFFIVAAATAIALLLCLYFAKRSTDPIREMIRNYGGIIPERGGSDNGTEADGTKPQKAGINELVRLDTILQTSRAERTQLRGILTQSYLLRVLSGGGLTDAEETQFLAEIPLDPPYDLVLITLSEKGSRLAAYTVLEQCCTEKHVGLFLSDTEICLLFGDAASPAYRESLAAAVDKLGEAGFPVRCGIAQEIPEYRKLNMGLLMARTASAGEGINVYELRSGSAELETWHRFEMLYQNILAGRSEEAFGVIAELAHRCSEESEKAFFFTALMVISAAAADLGLPMEELAYVTFDETALPGANMERARMLVIDLFRYLRKRSASPEGESEENRVVVYIRKHCGDPALCLAQISSLFAIPARRINEIVAKYTGKGFNDYLLYLRMSQVRELLVVTDLPVSEIAETCGYPAESTFFRVFKQYFGMSPRRYRELQRQHGQGE